MKLTVCDLDLPLRHEFTIAHGSQKRAPNLLVRLRDGKLEGLGEAAPREYHGQSRASARRALLAFAPRLERTSPWEMEDLLDGFAARFPRERAAQAALDMALHDLLGKRLGAPLWRLLDLKPRRALRTSFTLGLDSLEMLRRKVKEAADYPILKVKLGAPGDLELLAEVRRLCPRHVLRADANGGWSEGEARRKLRRLEELGVELLEEPLGRGETEALRRLAARTSVPLVADESARTAEEAAALRGCAAGVNVKLSKCGGLRAARAMIAAARGCGLKVMLGCFIESSLGISAAAQLARLADWLDLDGALLLGRDPFEGVRFARDARLRLTDEPGLGVRPSAKYKPNNKP